MLRVLQSTAFLHARARSESAPGGAGGGRRGMPPRYRAPLPRRVTLRYVVTALAAHWGAACPGGTRPSPPPQLVDPASSSCSKFSVLFQASTPQMAASGRLLGAVALLGLLFAAARGAAPQPRLPDG